MYHHAYWFLRRPCKGSANALQRPCKGPAKAKLLQKQHTSCIYWSCMLMYKICSYLYILYSLSQRMRDSFQQEEVRCFISSFYRASFKLMCMTTHAVLMHSGSATMHMQDPYMHEETWCVCSSLHRASSKPWLCTQHCHCTTACHAVKIKTWSCQQHKTCGVL